MANKETRILDGIIASRRQLLIGGGALAAMALVDRPRIVNAASVTDADVLNFALNLEYLEANFYTIATEGVTANKSAMNPITLPSGSAAVTYRSGAKVTFSSPFVEAYAYEIAQDERAHVTFLQKALGSEGATPVTQPQIDLQTPFTTLGTLIGAPTFDPFTTDFMFLLGAFIFEDVGVTAYHGGAPYITHRGLNGDTVDNFTPAVQIHATEAQHAGIIRTSLYAVDAGYFSLGQGNPGMGQATALAIKIANLRAQLDGTGGTANPTDVGPIITQSQAQVGAYTQVTDAPPSFICPGRTPTQVLDVVYASPTTAKGGFYPMGLNGTIS